MKIKTINPKDIEFRTKLAEVYLYININIVYIRSSFWKKKM